MNIKDLLNNLDGKLIEMKRKYEMYINLAKRAYTENNKEAYEDYTHIADYYMGNMRGIEISRELIIQNMKD